MVFVIEEEGEKNTLKRKKAKAMGECMVGEFIKVM